MCRPNELERRDVLLHVPFLMGSAVTEWDVQKHIPLEKVREES